MRRAGSRRAEHRVMRATEHGRVAAAQREPLIAGAGVDDGIGGAASDALPRDTADRLIAGAAAGNRVARGAPDRLVAAAAADDRLVAKAAVDEFVAAATADDRVVRRAANRLVVAAAADRVASAGPNRLIAGGAADNRHVAVHRGDKHIGAAAAED